jgi:hypothetical protein
MDTGQWYHICGYQGRGLAGDEREIYVGGISEGNNNDQNTGMTDPTTIYIGKLRDGVSPNTDAELAEIAIWTTPLTDGEAVSLAAGGIASTVKPTGLWAYWPLLDDENDDSGNNRHLTLSGSPDFTAHPPIFGAGGIAPLAGFLIQQHMRT